MKYVVLTVTVLSQACFGSLYAWSAFVPQLQSAYGYSTTQTQVIFGGLVLVNTLVMIVAGRLLDRRGPRVLLGLGGLCYLAGYLLAGFGVASFPVLFLGIAVGLGSGIGFGYVTLLVTCVRWFPEREGLATGLAVAGFGGGAIGVSWLTDLMLGANLSLGLIFGLIGLGGGLVILSSAACLKSPAGSGEGTSGSLALSTLFRESELWVLFVAMFGSTFTGLTVVGNLKPLALAAGLGNTAATGSISLFSAGNAGGRLLWGWLSDRLGGDSITASLVLLAAGAVGLALARGLFFFYASTLLVGLCFGAAFVVYVKYITNHYGADRVGEIYPLVFVSQGVSGMIGPPAGGLVYDLTGSYAWALVLALTVTLAGLTTFTLHRRNLL